MKPKCVLESCLYADNLDEAERFYCDVLGLEVYGKAPGRHVFFQLDSQMLLIFNPDATEVPPAPDARVPMPAHGSRGVGHVCFRASGAEIEAWRHRLESKGVAIELDFEWPGGGRSIYFRDPAGNSLEFAEPKIWGME